jgi:RimJ/RimL family protein N-acetyltransferase
MAASLHFKSAQAFSLEELAASFNRAFAGYFYPQRMTAATLARRVRCEQIDLEHSLLAFEGEQFVGIALLAIRGAHGWCGGFAIVPEARGRGCATALMKEFVARARRCGAKRLSLEVLARNTAARRLYEQAGMKVTRDLLVLERPPEINPPKPLKELKEAEAALLLRHFTRLHAQPPAWQRDLAALLATDNVRGLCLGEMDLPEAYALTNARADGGTQLIDLAAADEECADALCAGLMKLPGRLRLVNEPEGSLFVRPLLARGFVETDRQYEMACEL